MFSSCDELVNWARNVGLENGCMLMTARSRRSKSTKEFNYVCLRCDRGGSYVGSSAERKSGTKKTECPFLLEGKYKITRGGWVLEVKNHTHNHALSRYMEGHPYAMRFNEQEFNMVKEMTQQNVEPKVILPAVKEKFPDNKSSKRTLYNARAKIKKSLQSGDTPMQVFFHELEKHKYYYRYRADKTTNVIEGVFFIHPKSHSLWRAFPHVLMIDTTYKTNRYNMPFVQMVGVTSTLKSFAVAHAFISLETAAYFKWVLDQLDESLDQKLVKPRVVVSDRDLALMKACKEVWPEAARLVCRWHIFENINRHCRASFSNEKEWNEFQFAWKTLIKSPDEPTYRTNYDRLYRQLIANHGSKLLDLCLITVHCFIFVY